MYILSAFDLFSKWSVALNNVVYRLIFELKIVLVSLVSSLWTNRSGNQIRTFKSHLLSFHFNIVKFLLHLIFVFL